MISTDDAQTLMNGGGNVVESDGSKIGSIGQIFLDDQTGEPEWVTVKTGMFGGGESFVPLSHASVSGNDLRVEFDKAMVKDAPRVDADGHLDPSEEQQLYTYYGLSGDNATAAATHPSGQSDTGRRDADELDGADTHDRRDRAGESGVVGQDSSGPTTDDAMTRSEEELRVGTQNVETGKARLRKYIVTEDVSTTVPVSHEEVEVTREPITDANRGDAMSGGDLTEEEHEVTLHAERPVVEKDVVAKERVKLDTRTVSDEAQVNETLRKEQIDTDGATSGEADTVDFDRDSNRKG